MNIIRPERWLNMTSAELSSGIPGVWSGLLSFIGGSHHCVAYRFAVIE
jgi:cytochrome P450